VSARAPTWQTAAARATRTTLVRLVLATAALAAVSTHAAPPAAPATPPHPATPTAVEPTDPTPLLTYASTHHFPPVFAPNAQIGLQKQVTRITFDLLRDPPPATNCAQTLGAKRFATLYDDLAQAYSNMGEHIKAVDAYAKAIDCNPRADFLHAELAASYLDLGRYTDARIETQRQLHLGRANFTLYTLITQLDFIEGRWPDAVTNARIAATEAPTDEQSTYWQCFLWLAQMHAGTPEPVLVQRRIAETWPAPILESLQGKITEAELAQAVEEEHDQQRQRDILSEALFYTGQQRLAGNHVDEAVRYFTATVDLKVLYFIEHQLAMAELRKLRHPMP
jgi:predicted Zn-dependent protease